jgi:hypothetical protein
MNLEWLNDKEREEVESIFAKIETLTDEQKKQLNKLLTQKQNKIHPPN